MEKQKLVTFEKAEVELVTSELELSEVRGGKNTTLLVDSLLNGGDDTNGNCNCNCHNEGIR